MAEYTQTNWKKGDVITAEKLNNIESGISAIVTSVTSIESQVGDIGTQITSLNESVGRIDVDAINSSVAANAAAIQEGNTQLAEVKSASDALKTSVEANVAAIRENQEADAALRATVEANATAVQEQSTQLADVKSAVATLTEEVKGIATNTASINSILERLTAIEAKLDAASSSEVDKGTVDNATVGGESTEATNP